MSVEAPSLEITLYEMLWNDKRLFKNDFLDYINFSQYPITKLHHQMLFVSGSRGTVMRAQGITQVSVDFHACK